MASSITSAGAGLPLPMIDGAQGAGAATRVTKPESGVEASSEGFGSMLRSKLGELADTQNAAATTAQDVAAGKVDDVARAMLQIEQANVSLQYATQLRNKAIEAYQEILRMQV
jgi:flagellar hook-basal body complex protein FliE